jgi:hypothetical protein
LRGGIISVMAPPTFSALPEFWSFNRSRDAHLIQSEALHWQGPFSWPGYRALQAPPEMPDGAGVYLMTFEQNDGHILRSAGVTLAMRRRLREHERLYLRGDYTILDVEAARAGIRREHWHGWGYAKSNPALRATHIDFIRAAACQELTAYRLFIAPETDMRRRERIEFAILHAAYASRQPWGDLVDGGMSLRGRGNDEMPVRLINTSAAPIHGMPVEMEI